MLTVLTPATATALTTVARAKAVLGFGAADDAAAAVLIGQASRAIVDHCRRPFGLETVRETFADNALCGEGPVLGRGPVVEIQSVRLNGDLLASTEYHFDERSGRLQRIDADGRVLPWWGGTLVVEYRAGYVLPNDTGTPAITLPETVERAAILLVSNYLAARGREPGVKEESVDGVGSTSWWMPGAGDRLVSAEAGQLLVDYVRHF